MSPTLCKQQAAAFVTDLYMGTSNSNATFRCVPTLCCPVHHHVLPVWSRCSNLVTFANRLRSNLLLQPVTMGTPGLHTYVAPQERGERLARQRDVQQL